MTAATGTRWTLILRGPGDELDEHLTLLSTAGRAYWFDGGIVIQTRPTGFGDYHDERVIPWAYVIDYRKETL